ncbi:MAG TPA: SAM-dependent methyltransferase [Tissierellia bacterium]|nr:SAM-dependent methyltransferase [Tissierellia bacterium]
MKKAINIKHTRDCIICGKELIYFDDYIELECMYCHKRYISNVSCIDGHYVCDTCHSVDAIELIENYCRETSKTNPIDMAIELMKNPSIHMHGPEHHFLVPAVLITSYYNTLDKKDDKIKKLAVAKMRAKDVKGGFCGFYGDCGAAVGTGIYVSIILGASPLSKESWGLANLMTGTSLISLASIGGPRCCKRNSFTAIREAAKFTDEHFNVKLYDYENYSPVCSFNLKNSECLKGECPYYNK